MTSDRNTRDFVLRGTWRGLKDSNSAASFSMRLSQYDVKSESEILDIIESITAVGFDVEQMRFEMIGAGQRNAEFSREFLRQLGELGILLVLESRSAGETME